MLEELFADFASIYEAEPQQVKSSHLDMSDQEYIDFIVKDRLKYELKSFHRKILWSVLMYLFNNSDCTKQDVFDHIKSIRSDD